MEKLGKKEENKPNNFQHISLLFCCCCCFQNVKNKEGLGLNEILFFFNVKKKTKGFFSKISMKLVKLKIHFFPFPFMLDIKNELINLNVWSGRVMMIWNIILYMKINTFILDNRNLRFCFSKSFSSSKEEIYFSIQFACT